MLRLEQRLRRTLGIEPGEGGIVLWSAATLFLIEWASVSVSNASDTLFLKRVGISYLPIVFLVNSLLLTATTLVAGRVVARFDQRRLLTTTFVVLAVVLVILWLLVVASAPGIATTLVILSKQIDVIAALMFWTVISGLMTSRQGKRLVALMTGGGTLGTIFGSFTSGPFGKLLGIPALLGVAGAAFVAAALATLPLVRSAPPRLYRRGARSAPADLDQQPRLRVFWNESSLFRALVVTSFLAGVLGPILYFEFSYAADQATRTADGEQRLLALYGQLRGWINVGVLAVQIGGSAALFRRIGVPLAATLAPGAYLLGLFGLSVRFGLPAAMPATMGTSVIDHTIYEPAQRILAALLPVRMRTAATSFIQGPAKRAGAALGCLLILAVVAAVHDPSRVALVALPIAALWMGLAVTMWRNYPNLLLDAASVRHADGTEEESMNAFLDTGTMRTLQQNLEGGDAFLCRAACGLFADAPPGIAADAVTRALGAAPAANRGLLLATLDRVLTGDAARLPTRRIVVANLVRALKNRPDLTALEHARLVQVLGRVQAGHNVSSEARVLLEEARRLEGQAVRVAAGVACVRAGLDDASSDRFDEMIAAALASGDAAARSIALAELRFELVRGDDDQPEWPRRLAQLLGQLTFAAAPPVEPSAPDATGATCAVSLPDDRALVLTALADIAVDHRAAVSACAPMVLALADDAHPSVRTAVLRFVGNAGLDAQAELLTERLGSRDAAEAQAARGSLEVLGTAAADALLRALRQRGRRAREVVPELLRAIHAEPEALRAAIDREIDGSRELIVVLGVLDASDTSRLVLQRVRERVDESLRVALELLAAILDDDRIANVCRTLDRAWNVRDRAVLLEALEALLPAPERSRILPLLEDQSAQRLALTAAQALGRPWPTLEEAIARAVVSRDALTTELIAATVDRRLVESAVPTLDVDAARRLLSTRVRHGADTDGSEDGAADAAAGGEEIPMLSPVETMLHLRALDLFEGLTTRQLSELAKVVREVKVPDGETIVAEGEFDDRMYFIVSGTVHITREGQPIADLGARDFFGEMAVFDGERRSATATADGEVRMLRLARNDLFEVMEDQPAIGIGICQILVRRVRNMLIKRSAAAS